MTDMICVHNLLAGLSGQSRPKYSGTTQLLNVLSIIIDPMIQQLDLSHIDLLARSCRSLRVLTSDERLLYFLFQYIPSRNSQDTRRLFLIPRNIELHCVARCRYSQQHAFVYAMKTYSGLEGFRCAVVKRRAMVEKRRVGMRRRQAIERAHVHRRTQLVIDAIEMVGLPQTFLQIQVHTIRFIHIQPQTTPETEQLQLGILMEHMCWKYYLHNHTDFKDRVRQRIDIMGWYPGLTRDIEDEFVQPAVWPWLQ
jgi:hypothetical protein